MSASPANRSADRDIHHFFMMGIIVSYGFWTEDGDVKASVSSEQPNRGSLSSVQEEVNYGTGFGFHEDRSASFS